MQAAWGAAPNGSLDTAFGNPGQSMLHAGTVSNQRSFAATAASDAQPIVWEFDMYDSLTSSRLSGALRDVGGSAAGNQAFLEMGVYNAALNTDTNVNGSGYAIRHAFVAGTPAGASGWLLFPTPPTRVEGWHHFKATIGDTFATFDLDLGDDGSVDRTRTITLGAAAANDLYNIVRFGGPSDVSSTGPGNFDNLNIEVVPEPASLALVGLAGLFLRRRRIA
jgi:hypothetical protein